MGFETVCQQYLPWQNCGFPCLIFVYLTAKCCGCLRFGLGPPYLLNCGLRSSTPMASMTTLLGNQVLCLPLDSFQPGQIQTHHEPGLPSCGVLKLREWMCQFFSGRILKPRHHPACSLNPSVANPLQRAPIFSPRVALESVHMSLNTTSCHHDLHHHLLPLICVADCLGRPPPCSQNRCGQLFWLWKCPPLSFLVASHLSEALKCSGPACPTW